MLGAGAQAHYGCAQAYSGCVGGGRKHTMCGGVGCKDTVGEPHMLVGDARQSTNCLGWVATRLRRAQAYSGGWVVVRASRLQGARKQTRAPPDRVTRSV
jgi:hypothetical protein